MRNRLLSLVLFDLVLTALATLVATAALLAPTVSAGAQETHDHAGAERPGRSAPEEAPHVAPTNGGGDRGGDHEHGAVEARDYAALWDGASTKERAAARDLIAATREATQRWSAVDAALADGFSPNRGGVGPIHYRNVANRRDDGVLDAEHPEALVYLQRPNGDPILLGAVYVVTRFQERPTPAGDLAAWHVHGAPTNGDGCHHPDLEPGCGDVRGGMLHVWVYPGVLDPFADPMFASMGTPSAWRSKLYELAGSEPRPL